MQSKFLNNKLQKSNSSDEDNLDVFVPQVVNLFNKPVVINKVTANIYGDIREVKQYENLLNCLRSLEEDDEITIYINSPGGCLDTALEIIRGFRECRGSITCLITGEASSAASLIALGAPSVVVGDFATMLIHNATYGVGGKAADIAKYVEFSQKRLRRILEEIYEGFLSPSEIEDVLEGKELWINAEEINERFVQRQSWQLQQQEQQSTEEVQQDEPVVKPKSSRKAKV